MNIIQAEVDSLALGINAVRGLPDDRYSSFLRGPVHLPLDLDLLDPALALGASHLEPGWLCTPDVIRLTQILRAPTGGTGIVECDPKQDVQAIKGMSTMPL